MSVTLRNINRHFKASFSEIRPDVKIVVPADVLSYTDAQAEGGITVKPGRTIYEVTADPRSVRASETLDDSVHGHSHRRGLRFNLRRLDQDKTDLRTKLMNRRVHIIFTDENCQTYVFLNMKMNPGTAAEVGQGVNRTTMEFAGASRFPAPFVNLVLLPAPVGPTPGAGVQDGVEGNFQPVDSGGTPGGAPGDGIDPGGDGGGGGDPGGGDPPTTPSGRAIARQPSTGDLFEIIIDDCETIAYIPYIE